MCTAFRASSKGCETVFGSCQSLNLVTTDLKIKCGKAEVSSSHEIAKEDVAETPEQVMRQVEE